MSLNLTKHSAMELRENVEDLDLLFENLREKCLYEIILKEDNSLVLKKWFNYMSFLSMLATHHKNLN